MKYYERMIRQAEEKGKRRFERQFQDALQSLEAQLNVGYSMENAIKEVQRDLQIMSVIPLGIIGYMRLSFPEFMAGLYGNLPGAAFMSICLGAYIAAWRLGCKIVEIEV